MFQQNAVHDRQSVSYSVPSLPASGPWAPPAERGPTGVDKGGPGGPAPPPMAGQKKNFCKKK